MQKHGDEQVDVDTVGCDLQGICRTVSTISCITKWAETHFASNEPSDAKFQKQ